MNSDWVFVPWLWVRPDSPLTGTERLVLYSMCQSVNTGDRLGWLSEEEICKLARRGERTVRRAIRRMEKLGAVKVQERKKPNGDRDTNLYKVFGYERPQREPATVAGAKRDSLRGNRPRWPVEHASEVAPATVADAHRPLTTAAPATVTAAASAIDDTDNRPQWPVNVVEVLNGELNGEVNGNTLTACAKNGHDQEFEHAWAFYPRRGGSNSRHDAHRAWRARIRSGVDPAELIAGVMRYATFCEATGKTGTEFVQMAQTFFGPGERWREPWNLPASNRRPLSAQEIGRENLARAIERRARDARESGATNGQ